MLTVCACNFLLAKENWQKVAFKMMAKLTKSVNFATIL